MRKTIISVLSATLAISILSTTVFADFSDVKTDTHYKKAIYWMLNNGTVSGYQDGTFKPDQCVNRAEMLKMLFETMGTATDQSAELFKDTYSTEWYAPYIKTARAKGTIAGYPDGTFKPEQCVNRVEAIKMALLEFNNGEIPEQYGMYAMPYDISQKDMEDQWWGPYLDSALGSYYLGTTHFEKFDVDYGNEQQNDFLNPRFNFGPSESMTRKEVAEMLYRLKYSKDNTLDHFPGYSDEEIAFDGCGQVTDYEDKDWYEDFITRPEFTNWKDYFLQSTSQACLSLDGKTFIAILDEPAMYEHMVILKYAIETPALEETVFLFEKTENNADGVTADHYVTEFGKRVGDYIEVKGDAFGKNGEEWTGKYYYQENYVEKN